MKVKAKFPSQLKASKPNEVRKTIIASAIWINNPNKTGRQLTWKNVVFEIHKEKKQNYTKTCNKIAGARLLVKEPGLYSSFWTKWSAVAKLCPIPPAR